MKQMACEMCGGTDFVKQDRLFVCQGCGMKYSAEDAKSMMSEGTVSIQGTVKVDSSDELANLYKIARRTKDDNNGENAAKYYDMIMQECQQNIIASLQKKIAYKEQELRELEKR